MPINGFSICSCGTPVPLSSARCGVRSNPWVMALLRFWVISLSSPGNNSVLSLQISALYTRVNTRGKGQKQKNRGF